jgi:hypothetical protein
MRKIFFLLALTAGLVTACSTGDEEGSTEAQPPPRSVRPRDLSLASIVSIKGADPVDGQIEFTVTYNLHCSQKFDHLELQGVGPIVLARPTTAIGVWVRNLGLVCAGADRMQTTSFKLNNIAGAHAFVHMDDLQLRLQAKQGPDDKLEHSVVLQVSSGDAVQELETAPCTVKVFVDASMTTCSNSHFTVTSSSTVVPTILTATLKFKNSKALAILMRCQRVPNSGHIPTFAICQ